jgi:hypothetical protein
MLDTESLPVEAVEIFEELFEEPLLPLEELIEQLLEYREEIMAEISASVEFVDDELVQALTSRSIELLERIANNYDEEAHRHAQASVRYLMEDYDDDEDLGSVVGFDDDMEIFNAVVVELGHSDLRIGF